jgi:hypothetical protein
MSEQFAHIATHDPQPEPPVHYESYLLRLRRDERDGEPVCQVMLQGVASKEQLYFADLEGLVAFLQAEAPGQRIAKPGAQGREEETM